MFSYPLKKRELFVFLQYSADSHAFDDALEFLLGESVIFKFEEFYCLHPNYSLIQRRIKGNALAEKMLKKAAQSARLLSKFPFVRGVAISGSLSKNFADENADVDFFIITAPNRLWISRSFLHLFKKLTFLVNRQHLYCMNYFIDEEQLVIIEKNIYTATEVATLLPLFGTNTFENFYAANSWAIQLLPNHHLRISSAQQIKSHLVKLSIEKLFNNAVGNLLDKFLMNITAKSWAAKAKKKKTNSRGIVMALDTSRHHAKPSPVNFQQKLLKHYEDKLADIFDNYEYLFQEKVLK